MSTLKRKKFIRSTAAQIRVMINTMAANPLLAENKFHGKYGLLEREKQWTALAAGLANFGPAKSIEQWKHTWRDLKKRAKIEFQEYCDRKNDEASKGSYVPEISETAKRIVAIMRRTGIPGFEEVDTIVDTKSVDSESKDCKSETEKNHEVWISETKKEHELWISETEKDHDYIPAPKISKRSKKVLAIIRRNSDTGCIEEVEESGDDVADDSVDEASPPPELEHIFNELDDEEMSLSAPISPGGSPSPPVPRAISPCFRLDQSPRGSNIPADSKNISYAQLSIKSERNTNRLLQEKSQELKRNNVRSKESCSRASPPRASPHHDRDRHRCCDCRDRHTQSNARDAARKANYAAVSIRTQRNTNRLLKDISDEMKRSNELRNTQIKILQKLAEKLGSEANMLIK